MQATVPKIGRGRSNPNTVSYTLYLAIVLEYPGRERFGAMVISVFPIFKVSQRHGNSLEQGIFK